MDIEHKFQKIGVWTVCNRLLAVVGLVICLLPFHSCGQSEEELQRQSREERLRQLREDSLALKVAVLPTLDCLPLYVAKERRLFDTLDVDVRLKLFRSQMDCDVEMMKGRVEGCVTDLVRAEWMKSQGMSLRYTTTTAARWQLVANPVARVKQVKQLGDKMVAMTRHSATDYLTWQMLEGVKTTAPVFRIQINDVPLRLQMLQNNELDAFWLPEPQATKARLSKAPVLVDSEEKQIRLGVMTFNEKSLKDKRRQQQLKAFVRAYNSACDSLNKRGLQAYGDIVTKYCQVDAKTIKALPQITFVRATQPDPANCQRARDFVEKFPGGYTIND